MRPTISTPARPVSPAGGDRQQRPRWSAARCQAPVGRSPPKPAGRSDDARHLWSRSTSSNGQGAAASSDSESARPRMSRAMPVRADQRRRVAARLDHVEHGEGQVARIGRERPAARSQACCQVRASAGRAASSRSSASWRSPITRWVSSVLAQMMPPAAAVVVRDRAVGEGVVGLLRDSRCAP